MIRSGYVRAAHAMGRAAQKAGLIDRLERHPGRAAFYARSLFAIYDVDAMLRLDTPWWTFRAIDRVEEFLRTLDGDARVFEFGAGASTAWLARRAAEVHTVEHDVDFAGRIAADVSSSGAILHVVPAVHSLDPIAGSGRTSSRGLDFAEYVSTIHRVGGEFDLIVIDGRARAHALAASLPHLAPSGRIVFDNALRPRYARTLLTCGLAIRYLVGPAPSLPYPSCTALATCKR